MENKGKVELSLDYYDTLKEIERALEQSDYIGTFYRNGFAYEVVSLEKDETINELQNKISKLHKEIMDLKYPTNETTIQDLEKMSLFQLIKWKLNL